MKARDIIPGWPRGRSTTTVLGQSKARLYLIYGSLWPGFSLMDDVRFRNDVRAERAEERRKAKMMEAFYRDQRQGRDALQAALGRWIIVQTRGRPFKLDILGRVILEGE